MIGAFDAALLTHPDPLCFLSYKFFLLLRLDEPSFLPHHIKLWKSFYLFKKFKKIPA
jgi:hypothetical protein